MKKIYNIFLRSLVLVALTLSGLNAFAQTRVTGTVKDSKGEPLIGAAVILSGSTSVAAMTDMNGKYTITIPASVKSPKLRVNMMSYVEKTVEVGGRAVVDIVLEEDAQELEEVVVVGYGSMRRSDLTGSVSTVKIDEGDAARSSTIDQLLQGHAAGVQVLNNSGAPDAGISIRIRGLSSFNGSTEPLYVVDGIIINTSQGGETLLSQGLDNSDGNEAINGLMGLNPQDIASMEILKDASATAIYGALGANGVVLITTKSASKDRPTVNFSAGVDVSHIYKKAPIMTLDEYIEGLYYKFETGNGSSPTSQLNTIFEDYTTRTGIKVTPKDYQDECLRTAISQRYYFSISGRPKSTSYSFSLGYNDRQGIVKGTDVKQYTARLNLDKTLNKRFKFGTKTSFAYIYSDMTQSTGGGRMTGNTSMVRSMLTYRPYTTKVEEDDSEDDEMELRSSPLRWIDKNHFISVRKEYRITPSVYAEYKVFPWLTFKSTLGGDYRNREQEKFKSMYLTTDAAATNAATGTYENFYWNWDNLLQFNKKIKGHNISGTLGSTSISRFSSTQSIQGWNIGQYKGGMASINAAPNTSLSYSESLNTTLSFFVRAIYNFKDRYVLTATYRADGSSKFQGANKWSFFPSMAFAWRLNQEPWFNVPAVSSAKLRIGWGRVGSQSISNYQTLSNFGNTVIPAHNEGNDAQTFVAIYPSNLANPSLKWETTEQTNAGLDLSFFKGRLAFTADAYNKVTFDLLQSKAIPTSSGFSSISINEGTILNRGLEFTLDATPFKTRDFEFSVNGNLSFNRNKIVKISDTAEKKNIWITPSKNEDTVVFYGSNLGSSNYVGSYINIFMEGYPMGLFYGYRVKGIVGVGETGLPLSDGGAAGTEGQLDYFDLNGNGYLDENDRTIIGDPNPDFTYGFGFNFAYKRLSLGLTFIGSYGNDIFNTNMATMTDTNSNRNWYRDAFYKAWTPDNTDTIYPAFGKIRAGDYKLCSSQYVEDGSYLRFATLSLSYSIPMKDAKVIKNINIGASVNNLYVWSKYRGWDPDVNSFGTDIKKMGVDSGSYPRDRSASFDVKFTF